jgi:molybdopterin/thiamine biosynthesis adenylyltransferase
MLYVIGCGGVGSWLVPKLVRLKKELTLVDGDKLEHKNLDRQLFEESDIGRFKSEALAARYGCNPVTSYLSPGSLEPRRRDILFCAVDNHAARKATLELCDNFRCSAVFGANEYTDAEAYWYDPEWRGTPNDPRVFYPDILTDTSDDPTRPQSCTGAASQTHPQLVLANDWASGQMLHLYWYHTKERDHYPREFWPVHHKVSFAKFTTIRFSDR